MTGSLIETPTLGDRTIVDDRTRHHAPRARMDGWWTTAARPRGARHVSRVQGAARDRARHERAGDLRRARGTRSNPSCSLATRWQSSVTSNVDRDIDRGFRRLLLVLTAHCLLVGGGFAWRTITLPPRYIYTVVNGDGLRIPVDTEATSDLSEIQGQFALDGHGDEMKDVLGQAYELAWCNKVRQIICVDGPPRSYVLLSEQGVLLLVSLAFGGVLSGVLWGTYYTVWWV